MAAVRTSWLRPLAAALLCLGCSGCLHLRQELAITGVNSGRFEILASLPNRAAVGIADLPVGRFFELEAGSAWFAEAPGIELQSYRVYEREGRMYVRVRGRCPDLNAALQSGRLGNWELSETEAGRRLRWQPRRQPELASDEPAAAELRRLLADLRLTLQVTVPEEVLRSSGQTVDGRTSSWQFNTETDDAFLFNAPEIDLRFR